MTLKRPARMHPALITLAALGLSACASTANIAAPSLRDAVSAERSPASCIIPADLVGQPSSVIPDVNIKGPVRVLFPNTQVTPEQNPGRLTITLDRKGVIRKAACG